VLGPGSWSSFKVWVRARIRVMVRARVKVWVRARVMVKVRARVKVWVRTRVMVKYRARVKVWVRARGRIRVRVTVRVRIRGRVPISPQPNAPFQVGVSPRPHGLAPHPVFSGKRFPLPKPGRSRSRRQ